MVLHHKNSFWFRNADKYDVQLYKVSNVKGKKCTLDAPKLLSITLALIEISMQMESIECLEHPNAQNKSLQMLRTFLFFKATTQQNHVR